MAGFNQLSVPKQKSTFTIRQTPYSTTEDASNDIPMEIVFSSVSETVWLLRWEEDCKRQ